MKKILIIDDDKTFVELVSKRFDVNKYTVFRAEDGEEGLVMAKKEVPDVILLDLMMPKLGGIDFIKKIQENKGVAKIPIFIVTQLSSANKIGEGVELGIRGYIIKSNESIDSIVENIELILNER